MTLTPLRAAAMVIFAVAGVMAISFLETTSCASMNAADDASWYSGAFGITLIVAGFVGIAIWAYKKWSR